MEKTLDHLGPLAADVGVSLLGALVFIIVTWFVAGWVRQAVTKALDKTSFDKTVGLFLAQVCRWALLVLGLLGCFSIFGVETTSFAAILGAAGLAIGLALKSSLSNLSSGIVLLSFRPFNVGQAIDVDGVCGIVREIGLFHTHVDTFDKKRVIMPNNNITNNNVTNISYHPVRRMSINVGVEYSADIDKTREALEKAAGMVEAKADEPDSQIVLKGLGGSSVDWEVRIWAEGSDYWTAYQEGVRAIKLCLDEAGIGIPFPQMDVHIDGEIKR